VVKVVTFSRVSSPDEARLEQIPYQFHTQLIWRYLSIKQHFIDSFRGSYYCRRAQTGAEGLSAEPPGSPHFNNWARKLRNNEDDRDSLELNSALCVALTVITSNKEVVFSSSLVG